LREKAVNDPAAAGVPDSEGSRVFVLQKLLVPPILPMIFVKLCFHALQHARRRQAKTL
jgi:hypothetical protein